MIQIETFSSRFEEKTFKPRTTRRKCGKVKAKIISFVLLAEKMK